MADFTDMDYRTGKVICSYCHKPILARERVMVHRPTDTYYHDDLCFQKQLTANLRAKGLDTSTMPPEFLDITKKLFGIE